MVDDEPVGSAVPGVEDEAGVRALDDELGFTDRPEEGRRPGAELDRQDNVLAHAMGANSKRANGKKTARPGGGAGQVRGMGPGGLGQSSSSVPFIRMARATLS